MKCDISIIVATANPSNMLRLLNYIKNQSVDGLVYEVIIIQESHDGNMFNIETALPINNIIVEAQKIHNDYGANARDVGISVANGEYLVFWDDDNIYYNHALVSQYCTASGFDIGIVRTNHQNLIIPIGNIVKAGYIDTMCICIRRDMAINEKWTNNGGRYCDYRWISKILEHNPSINYSKVIIGHHL